LQKRKQEDEQLITKAT